MRPKKKFKPSEVKELMVFSLTNAIKAGKPKPAPAALTVKTDYKEFSAQKPRSGNIFQCPKCASKLCNKSTLTRHIRLMHEDKNKN